MTHVVVGVIVKGKNPPAYLLVSSKKDFGEFSGYYYPPGGHVEEGEDELSALKREVNEELGVTIKNAHKLTETEGDIKDQKTSWYLCEIENDHLKINHQELHDAKFFTRDEMQSLKIWPATRKIFESYIFNKR